MTVNKVELAELTTAAKSLKGLKTNNTNIYFNNGIVVTISTGRSFFANFVKDKADQLAVNFVETKISLSKNNRVTV